MEESKAEDDGLTITLVSSLQRIRYETTPCCLSFKVCLQAQRPFLLSRVNLHSRLLPPCLRKARIMTCSIINEELPPGLPCHTTITLSIPRVSESAVNQYFLLVQVHKDQSTNSPSLLHLPLTITSEKVLALTPAAPCFWPPALRRYMALPSMMRFSMFHECLPSFMDDIVRRLPPLPCQPTTRAASQLNYIQSMTRAIQIENQALESSIMDFDMDISGLHSNPSQNTVKMTVPGVPDKQPLLYIGDFVRLRPFVPGTPIPPLEVGGVVLTIRKDQVQLQVPRHVIQQGWTTTSKRWLVRFLPQTRLLLLCLHVLMRATSASLKRLLRPRERISRMSTQKPISRDEWSGSLNDIQGRAVTQFLQRKYVNMAVIGPPGTGKTHVAVAMAVHAVKSSITTRCLLVAPSNAACDMLVHRLHAYFPSRSDLLALNSYRRQASSIRLPHVKQHCMWHGSTDVFDSPARLTTTATRIVVCNTEVANELLLSSKRWKGHFSHVILDEAAQATVLEALAPIAMASACAGRIALIGDPHQLGPRVVSKEAAALGLGTSILEHWQKSPQAVSILQLNMNYRSHASIFRASSALFYSGKLQQCLPDEAVTRMTSWKRLRRIKAMNGAETSESVSAFHAIVGRDVLVQRGSVTTYYNAEEAVHILRGVKSMRAHGLRDGDIAVIVAFREQLLLVRKMLRNQGHGSVDVGLATDYQGREYPAIIISTVLSNQYGLACQRMAQPFGLLRAPRRMNVAITRAQQATLVIGNPHILWMDEYWKVYLKTCLEAGTFAGVRPLGSKGH